MNPSSCRTTLLAPRLPAVQLLAHRGLWREPSERNSLPAMQRAFEARYGVETDLRDFNKTVVISHDPADEQCYTFRRFLEAYVAAGSSQTLALNIKADGLAKPVGQLLLEFGITNYFAFDMSVPDMLHWRRDGLRFFTRHSEYEPVPALYEQAAGVWLDAFHDTWFTKETIEGHLRAGKDVCVVSPELHGRDARGVWQMLEQVVTDASRSLLLCTDAPDQWSGGQ